MLKLRGKNIFIFFAGIFCLSKPVQYAILFQDFSFHEAVICPGTNLARLKLPLLNSIKERFVEKFKFKKYNA